MPEATVYQCDKTDGLTGKHLKCGREVGEDAIYMQLTIVPDNGAGKAWSVDRRFCRPRHANYWLRRQRVL